MAGPLPRRTSRASGRNALTREITEPIDVAGPDGRLRAEAVGWARHPILRCALPPGVARAHQFEYWCFTTTRCAMAILVADVGFAGVALVSFAEHVGGPLVERLHVRPFGLPLVMPATPRDDLELDARRLRLALRHREEELTVRVDARTLLGAQISADLVVERRVAHETINVVVPFGDDPTTFHLTSKQQAMPTRGVVRIDGREHRFAPDVEGFACLDFGRGRWPSGIAWEWAFASGAQRGRTIGLNLGGRWTERSGVTENGLVLGGRVHKIDDAVDFAVDARDHRLPWGIRTRETSRVDLRFEPIRERTVRLPLGIASLELHQCMGRFLGKVLDDGGAPVEIDGMIGLAESLRARW